MKKATFHQIVMINLIISILVSAVIGFTAGTLAYSYFSKFTHFSFYNHRNEQVSSNNENNYLNRNDYEKQIIQTVKKSSPAVVSIIVTKDLPVLEKYYQEWDPFGGDEFFKRFFGDDFFSPFKFRIPQYRQKGTEKREIGGGTGFIVSPDGLILTNRHVVADKEAEYIVLTNKGEKLEAEVLARDPVQDIAILKVKGQNLPTLPLGDSDNLQIGQTVIAIGNALGEFRNTVSVGIISGLKRSITAQSGLGETERLSEVIQTDAAINRGNSGGPLLNLKGEVIGINVAMAMGAENIGFALPINLAKRDLAQVKATGKISYPFLGVRYVLINENIQKKNNLSVGYGALIVRGKDASEPAVIPGSPADKAGLEENDIILELNGQKITQENDLAKLIQKYNVGDVIELKVLHKGREKILRVKLGER